MTPSLSPTQVLWPLGPRPVRTLTTSRRRAPTGSKTTRRSASSPLPLRSRRSSGASASSSCAVRKGFPGAPPSIVVSKHAHVWQDKGHLLAKRRTNIPEPRTPPKLVPNRDAGRQSDDKRKGGEVLAKRNWATVKTDGNGLTICKMYNDARGCKQWCPNNQAHCCDVQIKGGKGCFAKNHSRNTHDPAKNGAPMDFRSR